MKRNLQPLVKPRSVAVVGASSDFRKVSGRPVKHLLDKGYKGKIYPVNPNVSEIGGLPTVPNIDALPDGVDLAIIVLPANGVIDAVRALGRRKVPAAVVFASGFAEMGEEGRALEAELRAAAQAAGVRLCGPNCLGMFNAFERVIATFSQYVDGDVPPGPVAFVSQSGAFGTAISALARNRGLGLGYFVNTGNEADVTFVDAMAEVIEDDRIRVGAGYIEGLKDGRGLCALADRAMELGKPLVLTKVGRTGAGARAAASHTGSLAGEDAVFDGVVLQKGILRARNEEHMLDLVEVLSFCGLPDGNGIGIATQSGGAGVLMADRAEELQLDVPRLDDFTQSKIQACIPGFGTTSNPVDVTGQFVAQPSVLSDSVIHMLEDPNVHVGIVWLQLMDAHVDTLLAIFDKIKASSSKPFVVAWVVAPPAAVKGLHERGIAVLRGAEPAVDAVAGLIRFAEMRRAWLADLAKRAAYAPTPISLPALSGPVPTVAATGLLQSAGVPMAPAKLATTAAEAVEAAEALGFPVVMKIESADILHKTEVDGVRLGLKTEADVQKAFEALMSGVAKKRPQARLDGVVVQPMLKGDVEVVIGLKDDPIFGTVIMAGLGGVLVEILKDVAFRKCPLTPREADSMLDSLLGAALFGEVRGRPAVNRKALVDMVCRVSELGNALEGRIDELDLNPVMVSAKGAISVDVLVVLKSSADASAPPASTPPHLITA
ncbi:acetate--CoA ligase family protein [Indioceanicola profundi]|uniref:acetate--CoA ligase family protein n=1 Tax=Indioceanicola profundi TaxID=2220096 RepID=UPI000E6A98DA|nr:acetate--CoA ligase family protein [Indioceanicola profundi]